MNYLPETFDRHAWSNVNWKVGGKHLNENLMINE